MHKRKLMFVVKGILIFSMITACQKSVEPESSDDTETGTSANVNITVIDVQVGNEKDHEETADYVWDSSQEIPIILNGNSITASTNKAIVNGSIVMTAGEVIVNGPTSNNNGAFDYDSSFKLNGGFIIAVGSSGMAQAPSTTLTQYTLLLNLKSSQQANSLFHIQSSDVNDIVTFKPVKKYQSIVFSSAKLT